MTACRWIAMLPILSLFGPSSLAGPRPQQSLGDGVFTEQQAARGQALYRAKCAGCHGQALDGRSGPPLAGNGFLSNWESQPLSALADKTRNTMPRDDSPRLSRGETADLLAYMLQAGKFPSGGVELPSDDAALKRVTFPARAVAAAGAPTQPTFPPAGNVAQVMRGILFPSANIVFTVQTIDPGERKPPAETAGAGGGFDWLTWGGGIYKAWDVVDYAALAVAESATLMLTPGRTCENGRPVPVNDPDWVRFTKELAEAGKASYKASQTRNQELVSDSTNQLNDACLHCHNVYRGRTHCAR
jgi:mono/diheme cytochrome c family protein